MTTENRQRDRVILVEQVTGLDNGDLIAECVDGDGEQTFWLLRPMDLCRAAGTTHGSVIGAVHERLGPLPAVYRRRLIRMPLRCGMPTRYGRPCRAEVSCAGQACYHHRKVAGDRIANG